MANQLKHLGIIMDGNRRFEKRLINNPWKGHEWGARKVEKVIEWCIEMKIREVTLWSFSIENLKRPKDEFDFLMNLFEKEFEGVTSNLKVHMNNV